MPFTESNYENGILSLLEDMGYTRLYGPDIARDYRDFMVRFYADIAEAVAHMIGVAGRRFTLPAERAIPLLSSIYERELRTAALSGSTSIGSFDGLGNQLAELLFAITEPLPGND